MGRCRLDSCDRIGTSGRLLREHHNEPSGSIKCWKYLDSLRKCQLLKNDSSAFSWMSLCCLCTKDRKCRSNGRTQLSDQLHTSSKKLFYWFWLNFVFRIYIQHNQTSVCLFFCPLRNLLCMTGKLNFSKGEEEGASFHR
jgi:hypothetical protein